MTFLRTCKTWLPGRILMIRKKCDSLANSIIEQGFLCVGFWVSRFSSFLQFVNNILSLFINHINSIAHNECFSSVIRGYTRTWRRHSVLNRMAMPKEMSEVFLDALRVFWWCKQAKPWPFPLFDETSVCSSLCSFVGQVISLNLFRLLSCHAVLSY